MTKLHQLVPRWRGFAGNRQHERWNELQAETYRACAAELSAALAETPGPEEILRVVVWAAEYGRAMGKSRASAVVPSPERRAISLEEWVREEARRTLFPLPPEPPR